MGCNGKQTKAGIGITIAVSSLQQACCYQVISGPAINETLNKFSGPLTNIYWQHLHASSKDSLTTFRSASKMCGWAMDRPVLHGLCKSVVSYTGVVKSGLVCLRNR